MPAHPEVLWAQRSSDSEEQKNVIYLTVNLPDIQPESLQYVVEPTKISFKAISAENNSKKDFAFDLDLFEEVVPEKSSKRLTSRAFDIKLQKKTQKAEYWPRLTKAKVKVPFIKTNFEKWVDEDEQDGVEEQEDLDLGGVGGPSGPGGLGASGFDFQQMMAQMGGNIGGAPLPGSDNPQSDDESDDEGPPPLEDAEPTK